MNMILLSRGLSKDQIKGIVIVVLILILLAIIIKWISEANKKKRMKDYRIINRGMSESQMLSIMGGGFSRSLLQDDSIVYEWTINGRTNGAIIKGFASFSHENSKKVRIVVKDEIVIEVIATNI